MTMHARLARFAFALLLLAPACALQAQQPPQPQAPDAAWEQLSEADRALLLQPLRERWNQADAGQRRRMYAHALRWRTMTPEQRARARIGIVRFERLSPAQRAQLRALFENTRGLDSQKRRQAFALFHAMRGMSPEARAALRQEWAKMSPQQRQAWMQAHAPRRGARD